MFDALSSAALIVERLPAQVFRSQYDRFSFLEFALFPNSEFLSLLERLMESRHDTQTNLIVLEPDPETYFHKNFGSFGALEIGADESWENYRAQMESSPGESPADSLAVNSFLLVWFPPSLRWIIWGERSPDMMVLAYCRGFNGPSEQSLAETGMRPFSAEDALDISSSAWSDRIARRDFARKVMDNYGGGRSWVDDAPERAIAVARRILARQIGLIEGCRALSSMRWELGDDVRERFIPFVAIDSETDDLPIGAVRDLWQPDALARRDLEISRCEQLYRTQVDEACMSLIESLGPNLAQQQSKDLP